MRNRLILALVVGLVISGWKLSAQTPTEKAISQLIEKLGSSEFDDREAATTDLDKLGLAALDALKAAMKSNDTEVRRRAEELVSKIEKREASGLLLKPTRVSLSLKDATVEEAVAALRKQTEFVIQFADPENKAKDVRVSLELKDATFFEALETLCEKAGLVETVGVAGGLGFAPGVAIGGIGVIGKPIRIQPPIRVKPIQRLPGILPVEPEAPKKEGFAQPAQAQDTPAPVPVPAPLPGPVVQIRGQGVQIGGNVQIVGGGVVAPGFAGIGAPPQAGTIVLSPGKVEKVPADLRTAFRVRAAANPFTMQVPGQKILHTGLEVTAEPRYRYLGHETFTIAKAIDDQDQNLMQFDPNAIQPQGGPGVGLALPPGFGGFGGFAGQNVIPLYFKPGAKPSKELKELTGTIVGRIQIPHSKAIVVEKLADASGKSIKGEKGGEIKIHTVKKQGDIATVSFELLPPKDAVGADNQGGGFGGFGGGIQIQPGIIQIVPAPANVAPALPPEAPPKPAPQPELPRKPGFAFQAQPAQAAPIQIQIQAQPAIAPAPGIVFGGGGFGATLPEGVQILDEKGNPVVVVGMNQQWAGRPDGTVQMRWDVQIQQGKDQPKLDRLTWQLFKAGSVDIPFTLKGVAVK